MNDSSQSENKLRKRLIQFVLICGGTIFVIFGVVGVFLPILPTTPFLLLASVCYSLSSRKLYYWLLNNKLFGNYIKNYIEGKGIPVTTKIFVISLLWITIMFSTIFIAQSLVIRVVLISVAVGVTLHILTISNLKVTDKTHPPIDKFK